jgi:hypothetical protein
MCRFFNTSLLIALILGLPGCGSTSTPSTDDGLKAEQALKDFGGLLKMLSDEKKRTPTKLAELDAYEPLFMAAVRGITNKQITYIWGAGYQAGESSIVAHDSEAATKGGAVLLQDGTIKTMTAAEFGAAPKATAKK